MKKLTAYIDSHNYYGYTIINVWDDDDDMYPLLWHNKFEGYTLDEIKHIINERVQQKLGDNAKFKIEWAIV